MYEREGFGLYLVSAGAAASDRHVRPDQARVPRGRGHRVRFLPDHRGQGYAHEAAAAVLAYGHDIGLERIVAITSPGNARSAALLEKLGMTLEKTVMLDGHDHEVVLYASNF